MYFLSAYVSILEFAATIQDGVLKIHPQLLFFAAKVQISTSESGPKWRFRTRQAAAIFSLNKDGGVFNGTMYILFTLSYKNALRRKGKGNSIDLFPYFFKSNRGKTS